MLLNSTLIKDEDGKSYVLCILPQFKKLTTAKRLIASVEYLLCTRHRVFSMLCFRVYTNFSHAHITSILLSMPYSGFLPKETQSKNVWEVVLLQ